MSASVVKITAHEDETVSLANVIAKFIVAGDLIRLEGTLGAGKSTFCRAVIKALGCKQEHIPSPTYTLVQTYEDTRLPIAHVDCYRMADPSETEMLDLNGYLKHGVTLVEWPQNGGDELNKHPDTLNSAPLETDNGGQLTILFEETDVKNERRLTFKASPAWVWRLALLDGNSGRDNPQAGRAGFVAECGYVGAKIHPVSEDASMRTYHRIETSDGSRVIMDAPPPLEDVRSFIAMDEYLREIGLHAPKIYSADEENGYLLLEDLGNTTLFDAIHNGLDDSTKERWYEKAVDILIHLSNVKEKAPVTTYSKNMLWCEVARFVDWYLPYATGKATRVEDRQAFYNIWSKLLDRAMDVPTSTVLWDYHAANLMLLAEKPSAMGTDDIAVIDFQDARVGPCTYDLTMLLQDARLSMSKPMESRLMQRFKDGVSIGGNSIDDDKFTASYQILSLNRTMKIIGGFTRLAYRDGKPHYLQFMPHLWGLVDEALQNPVCVELKEFLAEVMPQDRRLDLEKERVA